MHFKWSIGIPSLGPLDLALATVCQTQTRTQDPQFHTPQGLVQRASFLVWMFLPTAIAKDYKSVVSTSKKLDH